LLPKTPKPRLIIKLMKILLVLFAIILQCSS